MIRTIVKLKEPVRARQAEIKLGEQAKRARGVHLLCRFDGNIGRAGMCVVELFFGGIGYGLVEILWRGRTHWSMVVAGGVCFTAILFINRAMKHKNIFIRAAVSALFITAVEFTAGMILNRLLGLAVWNYSGMFGNILGQVCPLYTVFWFLLSLPICAVIGGKR